jgi:hypothetical protein
MNKRKQFSEIARATKRCCEKNGMGNIIAVWRDLSWSEESSWVARRQEGEATEFPTIIITMPTSARGVAEKLGRWRNESRQRHEARTQRAAVSQG